MAKRWIGYLIYFVVYAHVNDVQPEKRQFAAVCPESTAKVTQS